MDSHPPLLTLDGLSVRYGDALALVDATFDMRSGSVLAVLGSNGAGKSTLARAICGLVPISEGRVIFAGSSIGTASAFRRRRKGIVYLPEGRGVFPGLTVAENLRMAVVTLPKTERGPALERALDVFPDLKRRHGQRASSLSGGQQQMLTLARGIVGDPLLLIADEPSLGLAPKLVDLVFEALHGLAQEGLSIILIEQFVNRALQLSDDCLILRRGRISWTGPAAQAQDSVLTHYLGVED